MLGHRLEGDSVTVKMGASDGSKVGCSDGAMDGISLGCSRTLGEEDGSVVGLTGMEGRVLMRV